MAEPTDVAGGSGDTGPDMTKARILVDPGLRTGCAREDLNLHVPKDTGT